MFGIYEVYNKEKRNNIILGVIVSIVFVIASFMIVRMVIQTPEFENNENVISNQPLNYESTKKFWIEVNGKKTYSKNNNGIEKVFLGKINGKNKFKTGGYLDLFGLKLDSKSTKEFTLTRDYESVESNVDIPRYFYPDQLEKVYKVRYISTEEIVLIENDIVVYDTKNNVNNCKQSITSANVFNVSNTPTKEYKEISCPIKFNNDSSKLNLYVKDQAGNRVQISANQLVNIVPKATLNCNFSEINTIGGMKCRSNKIATGIVEGLNTSYQFTPNSDTIVKMDFKNGKNLIKIFLKDEHDLSTIYETSINLAKQI